MIVRILSIVYSFFWRSLYIQCYLYMYVKQRENVIKFHLYFKNEELANKTRSSLISCILQDGKITELLRYWIMEAVFLLNQFSLNQLLLLFKGCIQHILNGNISGFHRYVFGDKTISIVVSANSSNITTDFLDDW